MSNHHKSNIYAVHANCFCIRHIQFVLLTYKYIQISPKSALKKIKLIHTACNAVLNGRITYLSEKRICALYKVIKFLLKRNDFAI